MLKETSDVLISLVRSNGVTGAFLVLNTENLEEKKQEGLYEDKPGLYLHDYDPGIKSVGGTEIRVIHGVMRRLSSGSRNFLRMKDGKQNLTFSVRRLSAPILIVLYRLQKIRKM